MRRLTSSSSRSCSSCASSSAVPSSPELPTWTSPACASGRCSVASIGAAPVRDACTLSNVCGSFRGSEAAGTTSWRAITLCRCWPHLALLAGTSQRLSNPGPPRGNVIERARGASSLPRGRTRYLRTNPEHPSARYAWSSNERRGVAKSGGGWGLHCVRQASDPLRASMHHGAWSVQHCEATASRGGAGGHRKELHAVYIWKLQVPQRVAGRSPDPLTVRAAG